MAECAYVPPVCKPITCSLLQVRQHWLPQQQAPSLQCVTEMKERRKRKKINVVSLSLGRLTGVETNYCRTG